MLTRRTCRAVLLVLLLSVVAQPVLLAGTGADNSPSGNWRDQETFKKGYLPPDLV